MNNRRSERGLKILNNKKYAFFIDIDGTLTYESEIPSKKVIERLKYAQSLGHGVFINTGRARGFIPDVLLKSMHFDGIIAAIGQYIELDGKVIKNICLSEEQVKKTIDWMNENGRTGYAEGVYKVYSINCEDERFEKLENLDAKNISKLFIHGALSEEEEKFLNDGVKFYRHKSYVETAAIGCSKAIAMKDVLKITGFDIDVAIGDSGNDMEMILEAAVGIAVENSTDDLKSAADYIVPSNKNDGVASAVDLVLNLK